VEQGVFGSQVPSVMGLEPGGELSQTDQNILELELQFYTRRQTLKNTINPNIALTIEQSTSSNDRPSDSTSSSHGNSKLTPSNYSSFDLFDPDVPIAIRK